MIDRKHPGPSAINQKQSGDLSVFYIPLHLPAMADVIVWVGESE